MWNYSSVKCTVVLLVLLNKSGQFLRLSIASGVLYYGIPGANNAALKSSVL